MTAPAGIVSLPLKYLRDTIAASATFQTWVGALNATEALGSIHYVAVAEADATLPLAVVDWGRTVEWDAQALGSRREFLQEGELALLFRAGVTSSADDQLGEEGIVFMNKVGAVILEMLQLSGQATYLDIVRVQLGDYERPTEDEAKTAGDFVQVLAVVRYRSVA